MFNEAKDIMDHEWFTAINFDELYNKSVSAFIAINPSAPTVLCLDTAALGAW